METYYDLRPGASFTLYKDVQRAKGEKNKEFDIVKFSKDLQQSRGAYEMIFELTSVQEVVKPLQEIATKFLEEIARSDSRMVEYAIIIKARDRALPKGN